VYIVELTHIVMLLDSIAHTTYIDVVCCYRLSSMVYWSVTLVSPAKTAKPTEMPFGFRTRMGPGNHVLDWRPDPPWEGVILRGGRADRCEV